MFSNELMNLVVDVVVDQLPICASTGGLVDTVKEGFTGFHMGAFDVDVCSFLFIPFYR